VLQVIVAGSKVKLIEPEFEPILSGSGFENAYAFGDNFSANSIAGDDGYPVTPTLSISTCSQCVKSAL